MDDKRFKSSGEFYLYRRKDIWEIEKIVSKGDYNYAVVRGHPRATRYGYVLEHRVVMENHLGRLLSDDSRWPHNVPYQPNKYAYGMRDGKRVAACIRGPKCIDEPPARESNHDN